MKKSSFGLLTFGVLCAATSVLAACTPSSPRTPTPPPLPDFILPAPIYFLREGQIWRLACSGQTAHQITHEATAVESFDVSPADGSLVYVTDNTLIHTTARGEDRQVLLSGPTLPPIEDELTARNDRAHIIGAIATPVWSPDGKRIAYIQNGLNALTIATREVESLHSNDSIPEQAEPSDRLVLSSVISWSPDGQHLLITLYHYPLRSIYDQKAALKTLDDYLITLGDGFGCTFGWSQDSQTFYRGNASLGGSGALSRCGIDGRCAYIGQDVPARTAFFYAYPHVAGPDRLYVFMGMSRSPVAVPEAFKLYRVQPDGYGTTALRTDEQVTRTALWADDGRGVLIVTAAAFGEVPADTLVWLPADDSPAIPLPVTGAQTLHWGSEPEEVSP